MAPAKIFEDTQDSSVTTSLKNICCTQTTNLAKFTERNVKSTSELLVEEAMQRHVASIDYRDCQDGEDDAFFVADLGEIYRQHERWTRLLPRIKPHFAVKCNPDPEVLRLLEKLGTGFDCASEQEIEQVLGLGTSPDRIVYAQPCKANSHLRYAARNGVKRMTFDNSDELFKIQALFPDAELLLRIVADDSGSLCRLSQKFGVSLNGTKDLLRLAIDLGLNVIGVAFHCGSGASDPSAFARAVYDSRLVFDQAEEMGIKLNVLDCGGGFVPETFDRVATSLASALDRWFDSSVEIIAEPGRFYTSSAFTLACNVIARRLSTSASSDEEDRRLYLNDGIYGNLSCIVFDHQKPTAKLLWGRGRKDDVKSKCPISYTLWGPTCDGIDCVDVGWLSDRVVEVGDWLYFHDMGAYTKCSATRFNGFSNKHRTIYVCSEPAAKTILSDGA